MDSASALMALGKSVPKPEPMPGAPPSHWVVQIHPKGGQNVSPEAMRLGIVKDFFKPGGLDPLGKRRTEMPHPIQGDTGLGLLVDLVEFFRHRGVHIFAALRFISSLLPRITARGLVEFMGQVPSLIG